jgi:hypothetical protein
MEHSHPFQKAISCNNAGSRLIDRGDYGCAAKTLTIAFHSFKRTYNKVKKAIEEQEQDDFETQHLDDLMTEMPVSEANDVVVYTHPVYIPANMEITPESCGLFSTSITFNLALANHLCAMEKKDIPRLRTAARLYENGFSLERVRGHYSAVSPFFLMAILNNLGQIHRIIEDNEKSEKCFRQLLSTLMYLVQIKGANPLDLEMFFENTNFGLYQNISRCAGAA